MAAIRNVVTKELVILNALHTFGRNPSFSTTYIPNPDVSQSHATLFWQGGCWYLRDHSRNGTLIDGELVKRSTKKLLKQHLLQFGNDVITKWHILDLEPPFSYLKSLDETNKIIKLSSCLAFPDENNPKIYFYYSKDQQWLFETDGQTYFLEHGKRITLGKENWEFVSNFLVEETIDHGTIINDSYFLFQLSLDEEHINLQLAISPEHRIDMGNRSHNYLLLSLARKRLEHQNLGYSSEEQGWIPIKYLLKDISKEMVKEIDVYYLNLQIFRIRKQLMESVPYGYLFSNIIERRPGEIRFGHPFFKIEKDKVRAKKLGNK